MRRNHHCAAIVPCFNEAAHIRGVVTGIQKHLPNVIVVDDGSTDATAAEAKIAGAEILRLPKNSGKGAALRHGWRHAHQLGFQWVLMLDGDGQHLPADLPARLAFDVFHDEDAEIYVNGVLAATTKGYSTGYEQIPLNEAGRAALKSGKNIIAVHCHQTTGGQYIDVGIVKAK